MTDALGQCRLCLRAEQRLVKSHVFPKSFLFDPREKHAPVAIVSDSGVSKSQTGPYDYFLCETCEQSTSACDSHARRFCEHAYAGVPVSTSDGELVGRWCGPEVRGELIKRFAQVTLFRAHASTRPEFKAVDLGPFEGRLREVLLNGIDSEEFGVLAVTVAGVLAQPVLGFGRVRTSDVLCWRFHAGGVAYYIKVDSRPFPDGLKQIQLFGGRPVFAMHNESLNPRTAEGIRRMLDRHETPMRRILGRPALGAKPGGTEAE